jgi:hypothetical protein
LITLKGLLYIRLAQLHITLRKTVASLRHASTMKPPGPPTNVAIRGPFRTVIWAGTLVIVFAMLTLPYMGTMQSASRGDLRPGHHSATLPCPDTAQENLLLSIRKELDRIGVQLDPEQEYLFNALRVDMYVKSQTFLR